MTHDPVPATPPIQRVYDLSDLSEAGAEIIVAARADDLPALAAWFDVKSVEGFEATVTLARKSSDTVCYDADLVVDLTQTCVVSLEPVPSHHCLHVSRVLRLKPPAARRRRPVAEPEDGVLTIAAGDDDVPEDLDRSHYDLAIPLLEDLALDIDPYPRAEGVEFEVPQERREAKESPFAVLKRLKEGGT